MTKLGASQYRSVRHKLSFIARFVADMELEEFLQYGEDPQASIAPNKQAYNRLQRNHEAARRIAKLLIPLQAEVEQQRMEGVSHE